MTQLPIDLWPIAKIVTLFFMLIYVGFSLMVVRQISLMTQVLGTKLSPILKMIAVFHLAFAAAITLIAVAVL